MKKLLTILATVFIIVAVNKKATFAQEYDIPNFSNMDEVFFINECKAYTIGILRSVSASRDVLVLINPASPDIQALNSITNVLNAEYMNLTAIEQRVLNDLTNQGVDMSTLAPEVNARSLSVIAPLHESTKTIETKDMKHFFLVGLYIEKNGRCIQYITNKLAIYSQAEPNN